MHEHLKASENDDRQQGEQKGAGRDHEGHTCIAHAAQIDDGEQSKNCQTQGQRVRLQAGHGGNQRADAG
jgi:hypothetical protein